MTSPPINLNSDTQTRPTPEMRRAIAAAEVGDEQRRLDPTTRALEERVAELLGHEAGVFLPSGSMCNQIALLVHIRPGGDELLIDRTAHPVNAEAGGPARLAGAMVRTLDGDGGGSRPGSSRRRSGRRTAATPRARAWCRLSRPPTTAAGGCGRFRPSAGSSPSRAGTVCAPISTGPG